ncbi:MAG: hypothetical protein HFP77_01645 [Methylococcales symbiont of Iophon sp. n. MRB-2018]|nr:MAG: hypothetical protein HFP77_01645 [Methylococcales symbiont of Iophon sp. n. MRB-2018]KAF3980347.1 MAG: hypothetical protein HFP76_02535 [Methylococcales symbiont of Iophon sp. n. MRB-2018]
MKKLPSALSLFFLLTVSLLLSACSVVYKGTGDALIGYAQDQGVPYLLAAEDVALSCSMAESFAPFLLSFSRVTSSPDQLAVLFYLMAGSCTEFKAWEEELRYLRALYVKDPVAAQDARITQQRYLAQAARRQLIAYQYLTSIYSELGTNCPSFNDKEEELYWMMGLISGLQALINDIASAGKTNVPLDIAAKIGRAAACLNNQTWWGVPDAIQAALWIIRPTDKPENVDPMQMMNDALQIGLQQGIGITQVLSAQAHLGLGNTEQLKQIIRQHSQTKVSASVNHAYQLLNRLSILQVQQFSDRLWTEATGSRTPIGKIGTFWDDPVGDIDVDIIEIDGFL